MVYTNTSFLLKQRRRRQQQQQQLAVGCVLLAFKQRQSITTHPSIFLAMHGLQKMTAVSCFRIVKKLVPCQAKAKKLVANLQIAGNEELTVPVEAHSLQCMLSVVMLGMCLTAVRKETFSLHSSCNFHRSCECQQLKSSSLSFSKQGNENRTVHAVQSCASVCCNI